MLFELRNSVPDVSPAWIEVRDRFLSGKARAAHEGARGLRGKGAIAWANDYLLNIEIARACSLNKTYMALVRRAMRDFPDDPFVRLYHARVLLTKSRQTEGIEFLLGCEETLGRTHRAYWGTGLANMYASAGFEESCMRWLEAVQEQPDFDAPLSLYTRSCAREGLQQWDEAIARAERCIAAAPDWSRVRGYLAYCLLARGRIEAAWEQVAESNRRGHQEATVDVAAAMLPLSLGRFDEARPRLEGLLRDWPRADFVKWVRRTLCILLVELGDYAAAREMAAGEEAKIALPEIPERAGGRHGCIPLPLIAQNRNQCVPTSVAMAVYPQGGRFDPDGMFREMHGREGTPLWRMRQWCEARGFRVVPVRLEREAVTAMIEAGVPLIGSLEGPFNSHVEVVCGFNDDLKTLYVRDPGHWALIAWPWEIALRRYQMHAGLFAVIDGERRDVLVAAEKWRSDECAALLDLSEAVAKADRAAAETAYARIPDDSPAAVMRDGYGVNVVISPLRFRERMKLVSQDAAAGPVARFRAVMSLGANEGVLDRLLAEDDSDPFGAGVRRYLRLLRLMDEGDWPAARDVIDRLLRRGCGIAQFWKIKSDILAELGRHDASRAALERAIELEPLRMSTRERALSRAAGRLTLDQYAAELETLLEEDPEAKELLLSRAALLRDGPDGRAFEQAAREAIRWFPRLPAAYFHLLNWYLVQGRQDLHDELLGEARRLLPDVYGTGEQDAVAEESPKSDDAAGERQTGGSPAVESELPEDKDALLDLVWQLDDPRREAAVARVVELQQAGQLKWFEVARLVACRLLVADRRGEEPADPEVLLPDPPPGAPHWFADTLCDVLTDYAPSIPTALAVDRWLVRVVPNYEEHSELWFKRVLVLEHARRMEAALDELRKLLERFPATSSALYRMGVVKFRQQDYPGACDYLEQALAVNPGLIGAMDVLRDVQETLGRRDEALRCTRMLRRKMPYSVAYLRDEVLNAAELESAAAAERLLDAAAADFPERRVAVLRARLYLATDRLEEAAAILASVQLSIDDYEDAFEECLDAKLRVAAAREDRAAAIALCDAGLERWPDSTRLKEIKAEHLGQTDLGESRRLLRAVLAEGEPRPETAWQYLQVAGESPDQAARGLIDSAPEVRREELAELFSQVMGTSELLHFNEPFLTWALERFPESDTLRYRLMAHYNVNGRAAAAVRLAEELYQRNPDSPEAARMLGRCLIDQDATKALPYLERVCEQNRSVEYLFDLARCHQIAGNEARSQELHWDILEQNPFVSASWTNLYIFGAPRRRLWPYVAPMLDQGYGVEDEYFFVAAVKIALDLKQKLPPSWFPLAVERWSILQTHPGYLDERSRLKRALLAWQSLRPRDVQPGMNVPRDSWEALLARFVWPRRRWIAPA